MLGREKLKIIKIADLDRGFMDIDKTYKEVMGEEDTYASRVYYELMVSDLLGLKVDDDTFYVSQWSDSGWFSDYLSKLFDKPTYVMIYPVGRNIPLIIGHGVEISTDVEIIDMTPNEERIKMYKAYLMGIRTGMKRLLKKIESMNLKSFARWFSKVV